MPCGSRIAHQPRRQGRSSCRDLQCVPATRDVHRRCTRPREVCRDLRQRAAPAAVARASRDRRRSRTTPRRIAVEHRQAHTCQRQGKTARYVDSRKNESDLRRVATLSKCACNQGRVITMIRSGRRSSTGLRSIPARSPRGETATLDRGAARHLVTGNVLAKVLPATDRTLEWLQT